MLSNGIGSGHRVRLVVFIGDSLTDGGEVPLLTARYKAFSDTFEFFPAGADLFGFFVRDVIIRGGGRHHRQQIRKFLHDLVGRWYQECGVRDVGLWVSDEETTGPLADPLHESLVFGAVEKGLYAIQRVSASAAGCLVRWLGPLVDHGQRKAQIGRDLLWTALLKNFPQQFV